MARVRREWRCVYDNVGTGVVKVCKFITLRLERVSSVKNGRVIWAFAKLK